MKDVGKDAKTPMIQDAINALQNKDYCKAISEFTALIQDAEDEKKAFLLWSRVELNDNDNINKDCLSILELPNLMTEQELLPGVFSTHAAAAARLVALNEKLGHPGKAMAYSKMFKDLQDHSGDPGKATELKKEGNELFLRNQVLDAVKKYKDALGFNPKDHSVHSNLSRCFLLLGDNVLAKEYAEKCINYASGWSKGWYRLGKVHLELEAYADAAYAFKKALDLDSYNLELKRELAEAQYLADKLGNSDPGFDARTQGILYSMAQTSWDVMSWYKDNFHKIKFMELDEFDDLFSPHLDSFDFLIDVQNIMESRYPQYKKCMVPIDMDSRTKKKLELFGSSREILEFLMGSDPLLTSAIFLALHKRLFPKTLMSAAFTFDIDPNFFSDSAEIYPFIKDHSKYAFLVSTEGDGLVIDFMAMLESLFSGKKINRKWFDGIVMEQAFLKNGWLYTVEDKDELLECLEAVYKRDRLKEMIFETLKKSTISVKKSDTSDSVHTLTEETPKAHTEFSEPKKEESLISSKDDKLTQEYVNLIQEQEKFLNNSDKKESKFEETILSNLSTIIITVSIIIGCFGIYSAVNL